VTPAQHIKEWFTPELRHLINCSEVDRQAGKNVGTFSKFLGGRHHTTLEFVGVHDYYPVLLLLGYLAPSEYWTPLRALTPEETSSDIKTWVTPIRRKLLNLTGIDIKSGVSRGFLIRYLNNEPNITLKYVGKEVYYPSLQLFGFVPPSSTPQVTTPLISAEAAEHLLTWFTPERRERISLMGIDARAEQPDNIFSRFLAGIGSLPQQSVHGYYAALRPVGYRPDLDLSRDESVQTYLLEQQKRVK
jgi:hypothetical protein